MAVLWGLCGMLGMECRLATCKASVLPTVHWLQMLFLWVLLLLACFGGRWPHPPHPGDRAWEGCAQGCLL